MTLSAQPGSGSRDTSAHQRSLYALYDRAPPGVPAVDIDPFCTRYFDDPYPDQARLRDAGPFVWLSRYAIGAVARHEQVQAVLMDWRTFCSARGGHGGFRGPRPLPAAKRDP